MIKKILLIIISIIIIINTTSKNLRAEYSPTTIDKFIIVGGILGGIELIHTAYMLFFKHNEHKMLRNKNTSTTNSTDDAINKEELLKKLLAPSKLLTMYEERTNTVISKETNLIVSTISNTYATNEKSLTNSLKTTSSTQKQVLIKTNIIVERFKVSPQTEQSNFTYTITNTRTKESFEYTAGAIDYYDVGVAYYHVGKKKKAKEYLLHTIAINKKKKEAIEFLMNHYKITLKEIRLEAKKYKTIKK